MKYLRQFGVTLGVAAIVGSYSAAYAQTIANPPELPTNPQTQEAERLYLQGMEHFKQGNERAAITDLEKSLALNPSNAKAYTDLGKILLAEGKEQKAIENLNQGVKLGAQTVDTYANLCEAYHQIEEPKQAITNCDRALALDPNYAPAYLHKGDILLSEQDSQQAIINYQQAFELFSAQGDKDNSEKAKRKLEAQQQLIQGIPRPQQNQAPQASPGGS